MNSSSELPISSFKIYEKTFYIVYTSHPALKVTRINNSKKAVYIKKFKKE